MEVIQKLDYTSSLKAPEGYRLERLVATTYSLEPEMVYLLMTLTEPVTEVAFWDELALKKCLTHPEKLKIFYQEDKLYCRGVKMDAAFVRLLECCCVPVPKGKYAFHPKVLFAEYKNNMGEIVQRLIVSSRNLTKAEFTECAVVLERTPACLTPSFSNLEDLIAFVNESDWKYCGEAAEVVFQQEKGNAIWDRIPFSNDDKKVIVAPFFTGGEFCKQIKNAEFFKSDNIHGKIYFFESKEGNSIWLGSANCTKNGLHHNYECEVHIKTKLGIEEFKEWIFQHNGEPIEPEKQKKEEEKDAIEKELESFIEKHNFFLHITKAENRRNSFKCTVEIKTKQFSVPLKISPQIAPYQLEMIILGGSGMKKIGSDLLEWEMKGTTLSSCAVLRLVRDKERIQRMIKMVVSEDCMEQYKKIKEANDNEFKKQWLDFMPSFLYADELEQEEEADTEDDNAKTEQNKLARAISWNDGIYEKMVKLYTYGTKDLIQTVQEQIKNNNTLYEESVKKMLEKIAWMKKG